GGTTELAALIDRLTRALDLTRGEIIIEFIADDLLHQSQAVERVAGISHAAAAIGLAAILFDIAPRQRRAAEHHRDFEAVARHLFEIFAHHHRRFDQETGHADRV